jgi:hypothetical protein
MRKTLTALTLGLSAAGTVALAAPAQAAIPSGVYVPGEYYYVEPCAGSVIKTIPLTNELGEARGVTQIRYSGSLGGVVCAMTLDNAGGSHAMTVTLKRGDLAATASDSGVYASYAGGVAVPNAQGHCFRVTGSVSYGEGRVNNHSGSATFCR